MSRNKVIVEEGVVRVVTVGIQGPAGVGISQAYVDAGDAASRQRANHTGTQPSSTISDFNTAADARIEVQKGFANGLATLGSDAKIPTNQLPALAITDTFVVASQAAMLALTAQVGDVAIRTDLNKSFILRTAGASILANWQELLPHADSGYTNAAPVPVAIGGIKVGDTFSATPIPTVLDRLLYPYQEPAFTSFTMDGQATSVEVGTEIEGDQDFTWVSSNSSNVEASSVEISDGATVLETGLAPSDTVTTDVGVVQRTTPGSHYWTITGENSQSDSYTRNFTVNWYWRIYHGTSTDGVLTESDIEALTGTLAASGLGTKSYAAGGYKYLCYPESLPSASNFTDTLTGFDVTMADDTDDPAYDQTANGYNYALVSVTNSLGVTTDYRVYRTRFSLGSSINIQVT